MGQGGGMLPSGFPWPPPGFKLVQWGPEGSPRPSEEPPDPKVWRVCSVCDGVTYVDASGGPARPGPGQRLDDVIAGSCKSCKGTGWEKLGE
jgi:hypothetical protein